MTRRVEFVGMPCPLFDQTYLERKAKRLVSPAERKLVWSYEQKRQRFGWARMRGTSYHEFTPEAFEAALRDQIEKGRDLPRTLSLSQTYVFGPQNNYIVEMSDADYEALLLVHPLNAKAFRDLDEIVLAR